MEHEPRIVRDEDIVAFVKKNPRYKTKPLSVAVKFNVSYRKVVRALRGDGLLNSDDDGYEIYRTFGYGDF